MTLSIKHTHLLETKSTQLELRKAVAARHSRAYEPLLISTNCQTEGTGRQGSSWNHYNNALAFSFTLQPSSVVTLTPLEIGVHLANYFQPNLKLKWPNDLLNSKEEKVGGIICQLYHDVILVGVGLNLYLSDKDKKDTPFPYPVGSIFKENNSKDEDKENLPKLIFDFILKSRLNTKELKEQWLQSCCHLNKHVTVSDHKNISKGIFIGLGENGEALIKDGDKIGKALTGSLRIN
jgi:BirA family biotin operon repressor/biotin-[acetyl-CoA-carboxylase] ligase